MKNYNFIILIILLLVLSTQIPAQQNDPARKISIIEVLVPYSEVYDDGIYRKLYSSYQIFSEDGHKLLCVPEKYDRPAKIKLKEGNYLFVVILENGNLLEKEFAIEGNQLEVINFN